MASMDHLSVEDFEKCLENIVQISDSLMDGWKMCHKEDVENGKYVTKKQIINLTTQSDTTTKIPVTFEYHIAYHLSYGVPVLCFNIWRRDGTMLSLEDYWQYNEHLKDSNMYDTLTQMDHPVLCRPFLTLHPCKTQEILRPFFEKSKNAVISLLSVVGPFVHLTLPDEYLKAC